MLFLSLTKMKAILKQFSFYTQFTVAGFSQTYLKDLSHFSSSHVSLYKPYVMRHAELPWLILGSPCSKSEWYIWPVFLPCHSHKRCPASLFPAIQVESWVSQSTNINLIINEKTLWICSYCRQLLEIIIQHIFILIF